MAWQRFSRRRGPTSAGLASLCAGPHGQPSPRPSASRGVPLGLMPQNLIRILVLGLSIGFGACDDGAEPCSLPRAPSRASTEAGRWQQDLRYLDEALRACHPDPFHGGTEAAFEGALNALELRLAQASGPEIEVGLAETVALLGDAHTVVPLGPRYTGTLLLPLRFALFEEGLYVVEARGALSEWEGARVEQVGTVSTTVALDRVAPVIPHENENWLREQAPEHLLYEDLLRVQGILDFASPPTVQLRRPEDEEATSVELVPGPVAPNLSGDPDGPLFRRNPERTYWFSYEESEEIIYVQYNSARNDEDESFSEFSRRVFTVADTQPARRFVIDLRFNGGGNSAIFRPMLDGLRSREALNRPEVLYVIIGQGTFSSAVLNALELERNTEATLVGAATGGKPSAFGEVRRFLLPNSRLAVFHSTRFFDLDTDAPALEPDLPVLYTAADYFAGRDPALEVIRSRPDS